MRMGIAKLIKILFYRIDSVFWTIQLKFLILVYFLVQLFYTQIKCHQYYPIGEHNEGEDEMVFYDVGLKVTFIEERDANYHYTSRVLHLHDLEVRN